MFLGIPFNSIDAAILMLTGINVYRHLYDRITLIYSKIKKYSTAWILKNQKEDINNNIKKATMKFDEICAEPFYVAYEAFKTHFHTIGTNHLLIWGGEILRKNMMNADISFPTPKEMNSLLYKTMWFEAKTKSRLMCKHCHVQWSSLHISQCPILQDYEETIQIWKKSGFMRPDLYDDNVKAKKEGLSLKKAISIIKENSYKQRIVPTKITGILSYIKAV